MRRDLQPPRPEKQGAGAFCAPSWHGRGGLLGWAPNSAKAARREGLLRLSPRFLNTDPHLRTEVKAAWASVAPLQRMALALASRAGSCGIAACFLPNFLLPPHPPWPRDRNRIKVSEGQPPDAGAEVEVWSPSGGSEHPYPLHTHPGRRKPGGRRRRWDNGGATVISSQGPGAALLPSLSLDPLSFRLASVPPSQAAANPDPWTQGTAWPPVSHPLAGRWFQPEGA